MNKAVNIVEGTINAMLNKNEQLVVARRLICSHCNLYDQKNDGCLICGCPINKKGRVEREHCPIKKW